MNSTEQNQVLENHAAAQKLVFTAQQVETVLLQEISTMEKGKKQAVLAYKKNHPSWWADFLNLNLERLQHFAEREAEGNPCLNSQCTGHYVMDTKVSIVKAIWTVEP